ncbi:MAG: hypothetical protein ACOC5A_00470 [Halanaerobiales bacterium]
MKKRIISFVLILAIMGMAMMLLTGCNSNNTATGSNGNKSIFTEGEVYAITGEFNDDYDAGIVFGLLFVEVLDINDKWIKVNILEDENVIRELEESSHKQAKDEGLFKDIWINTEKIHYVLTEPDFSNLQD